MTMNPEILGQLAKDRHRERERALSLRRPRQQRRRARTTRGGSALVRWTGEVLMRAGSRLAHQ
jgi:hypothetical protein